jgi:hypothetical protein
VQDNYLQIAGFAAEGSLDLGLVFLFLSSFPGLFGEILEIHEKANGFSGAGRILPFGVPPSGGPARVNAELRTVLIVKWTDAGGSPPPPGNSITDRGWHGLRNPPPPGKGI